MTDTHQLAVEAAHGCCGPLGDPSWHGQFCSYHQGFEAGAAATMAAERTWPIYTIHDRDDFR